MIENQTTVYREPRQPYDQYMTVKSMYRRRREPKQADVPCIVPVNQILGGRFDAKS